MPESATSPPRESWAAQAAQAALAAAVAAAVAAVAAPAPASGQVSVIFSPAFAPVPPVAARCAVEFWASEGLGAWWDPLKWGAPPP